MVYAKFRDEDVSVDLAGVAHSSAADKLRFFWPLVAVAAVFAHPFSGTTVTKLRVFRCYFSVSRVLGIGP